MEFPRDKWESVWIRGGIIKNIFWIDKNVMAWSSGNHIIFYNVDDNKTFIYRCSSDDGACCASGNPWIKIFAYSEKSCEPKILIYSYPSMKKISECIGCDDNGYLAIVFTPSEFLLSLGKEPNFSLTIWSWRSGEKLQALSTSIEDYQGQFIKVSLCARPIMIAQLGPDSGKLLIWEMILSPILLSSEEVLLPKNSHPVDCEWSPDSDDPILAIVDDHGHVYISNKEGCEINRVIFSQRCTLCTNYEIPIVCWYRDGIILKTTFCQIRYYKKYNENNWKREWCLKTTFKPCLLSSHPFKKDKMYYYTLEGYLDEICMLQGTSSKQPNIEKKLYLGDDYRLVNFIYPWGHHLVVINDKILSVIDAFDANELIKFNIDVDGDIIQFLSHMDYPLIALTTKNGELLIIALHQPEKPSIIRRCWLQNNPLDLLVFSHCGRHLLAAEKNSGTCYCLVSSGKIFFSTIHSLNVNQKVADVIFFEAGGTLRVVVLLLASRKIQVGNRILIYQVSLDEGNVREPLKIIQLPSAYQSLHYAPGNEANFVATPYLSRQIHFLNLHNDEVNLLRAVSTNHQVRGIKLSTNRETITTCGFDGLITVLKTESSLESFACLITHHRKDLGVDLAICRPSGDLIIARGRDKSLVCIGIKKKEENKIERLKKYSDDYAGLEKDIVGMLSGLCLIIPSESDPKMTWVDWKKSLKLEEEAKQCWELKSTLLDNLNKIKNKISIMLDENETCPVIEQLPISSFDLNFVVGEQNTEESSEKCEDKRLELEFKCSDFDRIAEWIKNNMWDTQEIKDQSICEIYGNMELVNYGSVVEDPQEMETTRWIETFQDVDEKKKKKNISKIYLMMKEEYDLSLYEDGVNQDIDQDDKDLHASAGTTTHRFIDSSCKISQFKNYTFMELLQQNSQLMIDSKKLRNYFNKIFSNMLITKELEMSRVRDFISKIRFIDSELKSMFDENVPMIPGDPVWTWKEKSESIVEVSDDEIQVKPWMSTSELDLLNQRIAEAERLRLLLLADDFRARALMAMMDGVMEVRWEDIIKKDIPKPQCMLNKIPEDYTVDDIVAVRKYENQVEFLTIEREKYRKILYSDYSKVMKSMKDGFEKFNNRLKEFYVLRLKLESGIQQLNLLRARGYLRAKFFNETSRKKLELVDKILNDEKNIEKIRKLDGILREKIPVLRDQREELLSKEKLLVKKFSVEFSGVGKKNLELLKKEYKKRPKVSLKNPAAGDVVELGKIILKPGNFVGLSSDFLEYLKGLEVLDIFPLDLPESVEPHHWQLLVKLRRSRIDLELKIKANIIELNDIEKSIGDHYQRVGMCREEVCNISDELNQIENDRDNFDLDFEIQLVLQMGQIEIPLEGDQKDAENSNLIPRDAVEEINNEILSHGVMKLWEINKTIKYRRGTLLEEWEHKYRRMRIEDLQDELYQVKKFFVTKDIHDYLKKRSANLSIGKTTQQLERELEAMRKNLEKSLGDWLIKLDSIEKKIKLTKRNNEFLDDKITKMNIERWELELQRDLIAESQWKEYTERKIKHVTKRSKLLRKIQENFTENMSLKKDNELLLIKKFPNCSFLRVLNTDEYTTK